MTIDRFTGILLAYIMAYRVSLSVELRYPASPFFLIPLPAPVQERFDVEPLLIPKCPIEAAGRWLKFIDNMTDLRSIYAHSPSRLGNAWESVDSFSLTVILGDLTTGFVHRSQHPFVTIVFLLKNANHSLLRIDPCCLVDPTDHFQIVRGYIQAVPPP